MPPHPLTKFEIQKYYQNETRFNGVYSRNNFPKIKDGAYLTNLDEYKSTGTHWITLYVNDNNVIYFDSFGVELIPKEIKKSIGNRNTTTNIFRIQAYNWIMCVYFCIVFINFLLKGKSYNKVFSIDSKKVNMKKSVVSFVVNINNLQTIKYHTFLEK